VIDMPICSKCKEKFPYKKMFCPLYTARATTSCYGHKSQLVCENCADDNISQSVTFIFNVPVLLYEKRERDIEEVLKFVIDMLKFGIDRRIERL